MSELSMQVLDALEMIALNWQDGSRELQTPCPRERDLAAYRMAFNPTTVIDLIRLARECDRLATENASLSDDVDLEMGIAVSALEDYARLTDELTDERLKAQVAVQRVRDERADAISAERISCARTIAKAQIAAKCEARTLKAALKEALDAWDSGDAMTRPPYGETGAPFTLESARKLLEKSEHEQLNSITGDMLWIELRLACDEVERLRAGLTEVLDELEATIAPAKHAWIDERRKLVSNG